MLLSFGHDASRFAGLSLTDMGGGDVNVEVEKKGEGQGPVGPGICFSVAPSSLEDDQLVLTCLRQPESFQPHFDKIPLPGNPGALDIPAPPPEKMYFWRNGRHEEDLVNYTFRHPAIGQFTRWLWSTPEGQKATITEVREHLSRLIQDVVLDGLSEEEKQQNPFVKAFLPNSQRPAYLLPPQEKPAFAWTLWPFPKRNRIDTPPETPGNIFRAAGRLSFSNM